MRTFAALCLVAIASAHPHHKGGKGHNEHKHPIRDAIAKTIDRVGDVVDELFADVPTVPAQWKADAVQDMEGNVPGVRPGKTPYTSYYDYPNRHRYQYATQDQIFDFQAGKVYKVKSNGKCCYADNVDPDTGAAKAMIQIAPTSKAKDKGAVADGEDWQQKVNLVVMKETTDFVLRADNTVADWNQDIRVGKDGSQYVTVDVAYTNTVVGGLTDADFLTDVTATCTNTCAFSEEELSFIEAGLAYFEEDSEEDNGFDDDCSVPTGVDFGIQCRMQELCGTGCAAGKCQWSYPTGTSMDDPATACACSECKATDLFLH